MWATVALTPTNRCECTGSAAMRAASAAAAPLAGALMSLPQLALPFSARPRIVHVFWRHTISLELQASKVCDPGRARHGGMGAWASRLTGGITSATIPHPELRHAAAFRIQYCRFVLVQSAQAGKIPVASHQLMHALQINAWAAAHVPRGLPQCHSQLDISPCPGTHLAPHIPPDIPTSAFLEAMRHLPHLMVI